MKPTEKAQQESKMRKGVYQRKNSKVQPAQQELSKDEKAYKIEEPEVWTLHELDFSATYSYASYLRWRFAERVELIKGKIFQMAAPTTKHQICTGEVFAALHQFLKGKPCRVFVSPFDVRFPDLSVNDREVFTVLQPDLCVVCDDHKIDSKGCVGAPDLVVEVLSPCTDKKELDFKYKIYEASGVREYWVLDPSARSLMKYVLDEAGIFIASGSYTANETFASDVLPGFCLNMADVFDEVSVF